MGQTPETKKFLSEHPEIIGIWSGDASRPSKVIKKNEIPRLILTRILPRIMSHFSHLDEDQEMLYEAGLFNTALDLDDRSLDSSDEESIKVLSKLLKELK